MSRRLARKPLRCGPEWAEEADSSASSAAQAAWAEERETLLEMLAQQQRVAQAGLVTAALSHDVNNHVQAIMGAAYLALKSGKPERMLVALEKIETQCVDLADTTRAFLDFVKRRDQVGGKTFELSSVIEQTARLLAPLAKREQVALEHSVEGDATVGGESRLIIQALVNLASNAIRACAPSRGTVSIRATTPMPGWCTLAVRDDGPGIPEEMRSRLFRPFATGHENAGGNGLGLFIVRQAVRKLGGTIRVRTSPAGTVIRLSLPTA